MIVIIDYDIGNVAAVANMFKRLGHKAIVSADPHLIAQASHLVLPGNGSFDACMRNLRSSNLISYLETRVFEEKIPLLGICVGAQMLGKKSEEGIESGLAWLDMDVCKFPNDLGLRVPHMGWSEVSTIDTGNSLASGLDEEARFYFTHSYYMKPGADTKVLFETKYGITFASAVLKSNIVGVQFHPEKSHRFGKILMSNFVNWGK